ncbi:MAG TPA: 4a-hydroxytetrahydrobiopterin dehydratase [Gemmatimonadales bacterium]|nr:4a-hydroxytetrahydrobiopterin dehydratase [Gemmatimonadales bacterium]
MGERSRLGDAEIAKGLLALPGWTREGNAIVKRYSFATFAEGIRFVDRVAVAADAADHHPDIDIRWTTVTMSLSTHSAGGITAKDLSLAATIEQLARG